MTAIVMNTKTAAVTEYDWQFQSITPTHAGDVTGLYTLGGDTDNGTPIASSVLTGKTLFNEMRRKMLGVVFFALTGTADSTGRLRVKGQNAEWFYSFPLRINGVSRAKPGMGIKENYLAFGFQNEGGADFKLDNIEVEVAQSASRRT